jgi:hypothetical protein
MRSAALRSQQLLNYLSSGERVRAVYSQLGGTLVLQKHESAADPSRSVALLLVFRHFCERVELESHSHPPLCVSPEKLGLKLQWDCGRFGLDVFEGLWADRAAGLIFPVLHKQQPLECP